ncbi:hypothetical protein N7478_004928 [Penicillium angulare]|uniref:uncharacterized protein n=1 Tax=Penicillium angulare TaxID=116970 RepID=UPI00253FDAE8|nr:uncharacterized protein N7478_004928 [Penicillium angulare]KAJ5279556.1 hypothetical protein N7478_004928 [Penicillium angulare]
MEEITGLGYPHCTDEISAVLHYICPASWKITRNVRDDRYGELTSIAKKTPQDITRYRFKVGSKVTKHLKPAWDRVWPDPKSKDWRTNWHGLPLARLPDPKIDHSLSPTSPESVLAMLSALEMDGPLLIV